MSPEQAIADAKAGKLAPVYLLLGEEHHQQHQVLTAIRDATLEGGIAGLNDDQFVAGEADVDAVISTAKTVPMMAKRRLVVVRSVERWDSKGGKKGAAEALDKLTAYVSAPADDATLVLLAGKLDKRRKLVTVSKKAGFVVDCQPLSRDELPRWIQASARLKGNPLAPGVADLLAELAGPELGNVDDALERVCLYAGADVEVTEDAVAECIVRVRPATVWELVDAIGQRDAGAALDALSKVYDPQDRGLRLLGVLGWSARQLLKFESAAREGLAPADAAKKAGAPPFKARQLNQQIRRFPRQDLERWLETLAGVDLALKGGSKRPPRAVLENAIIGMCTGGRRRRATAHA